MNGIIKNTIVITGITLVAGTLLGTVYEITKEPIAKQNELAKQEACQSVFTEADSFEPIMEGESPELQSYLEKRGFSAQTIDEVMEAKDSAGTMLGYVLTVTSGEGYGGDITFTMGLTEEGMTTGISFLSISETAGLGMKADTDEFKEQFEEKLVEEFEYSKTGAVEEHHIDALSGATVTTNAVTNGVNAGLAAYDYLREGES